MCVKKILTKNNNKQEVSDMKEKQSVAKKIEQVREKLKPVLEKIANSLVFRKIFHDVRIISTVIVIFARLILSMVLFVLGAVIIECLKGDNTLLSGAILVALAFVVFKLAFKITPIIDRSNNGNGPVDYHTRHALNQMVRDINEMKELQVRDWMRSRNDL